MNDIKIQMVSKLKELCERDRLVLCLYYYEDMTLVEVAKVLSMSEKTAQKALDIARSHLKEKL